MNSTSSVSARPPDLALPSGAPQVDSPDGSLLANFRGVAIETRLGTALGAPAAVASPTPHRFDDILPLNASWRVNGSDGVQWQLERRRVSDKWEPRRFHVERDCLLLSVLELCGEVEPMAVATIRGWPGVRPRRR